MREGPSALQLRVAGLSWRTPRTVLLQDSGALTARDGQCIGIIGPPGSGKSAFLHLLAGHRLHGGRVLATRPVGSVRINGRERCARCWFRHTRLVCSQDALVPSLTWRQALLLEAQLLGLPPSTTTSTEPAIQDTLLAILLADPVLGARRTIQFGLARALLAQPRILFADELSGLVTDAKALSTLLRAVRAHAQKPCATSCTCIGSTPSRNMAFIALDAVALHLPGLELGTLFDQVMLTTRSQRVLFTGTLDEAVTRFGSLTALLAAMDAESDPGADATDWPVPSAKPPPPPPAIPPIQCHTRHIAPHRELWLLLRAECCKLGNRPRHWTRVALQRILLFTLLSFIFHQPPTRTALFGLFFFLPINQTTQVLLLTATEGFPELASTRAARFRTAHRPWTLLGAKLVLGIGLNWLPALAYLPALFFIAGFRAKQHFCLFLLANLASIAATVPLGLLVATASTDPAQRDLVLFLVTTLVVAFSGIHTAANYQLTWLLRWAQYLSPAYGLFAISLQLEYRPDELFVLLRLGTFSLSPAALFGLLLGLLLLFTAIAALLLHRTTAPMRILL